MRHLIFFISYIYFLYSDLRNKKMNIIAIGVYAILALITVVITKKDSNMESIIDIIYSVGFGLIVYMMAYFSNEGIGIADGMYFVINGFLLTLKENVVLFLTGLLVAFIIGVFMYLFNKNKMIRECRIPFIPCLLPVIVGYIICIV